ncbi:MAG TPA: GatB/YqeY domain-containing protein [Candidatus Omnitrophota bacterium]|nr:GatB/YqeY domain-containing protein [Candidatus Omnitrophota bacterium]
MLEEKIQKDYVQAMKSKDNLRAGTLSFLRAQLKNVIINEKKEKLEDTEVIAVIKKQVKQRQESIEQFKAGGRNDLADKEQAELNILKGYLPQEMSENEINQVVKEAMKETGAGSMKDMGQLMKVVLPRLQGRADSKLVSDLVKKALSGQ